jgi:hypothetical protein
MIRYRVACIVMPIIAFSSVTLAQDATAPAAATSLVVVDGRAEPDKKQKMLSFIITSCDYAVQRLGDKKVPGRIAALQQDLAQIKGAALDGKTLTVSRYHIYFNNSAILRGMVYPQYTGVIPAMMKEKGVACPREKSGGGWFDVTELTAPFSPLILDIEASLDGAVHSVRVVHSPPRELPGNFKKPEDAADLAAAMRAAAEALASKIQ